jgi:hypothetical protein
MNPLRKLLILLETVTSSLRGAKRRGNLRLPRVLEDIATVYGHLFEANGDHNKASLLAMTRFRFVATPKYAGIQQARDDECGQSWFSCLRAKP